jgi:hypothetical protein
MYNSTSPFTQLPFEISEHIFSLLIALDLVRTSAVSKNWRIFSEYVMVSSAIFPQYKLWKMVKTLEDISPDPIEFNFVFLGSGRFRGRILRQLMGLLIFIQTNVTEDSRIDLYSKRNLIKNSIGLAVAPTVFIFIDKESLISQTQKTIEEDLREDFPNVPIYPLLSHYLVPLNSISSSDHHENRDSSFLQTKSIVDPILLNLWDQYRVGMGQKISQYEKWKKSSHHNGRMQWLGCVLYALCLICAIVGVLVLATVFRK